MLQLTFHSRGHKDEINQIKVNPAGTRLASCSDDMTIRIWNVASVTNSLDSIPGLGGYSSEANEHPVVLKGHTHSVSTVEWFTPPGQTQERLATYVLCTGYVDVCHSHNL